MNVYPPEIWIGAGLATLAVVVGFSIFARWCAHSPAVGRQKLEALQVGMSVDQVRTLLGEPRQKKPGDKGEEFWIYGSQWKRHLLVVEFNGTGKMREYVHGVPHFRKKKQFVEN